jgi:hypothetical protein
VILRLATFPQGFSVIPSEPTATMRFFIPPQ